MTTSCSVQGDFDTGRVGFLVLYTFIAGGLGDILIHFLLNYFKSFPQGLKTYYDKLEYGKSKISRILTSYIFSAVLGGIACVIGLLLGLLFLYAQEQCVSSA